MKDILKLLKNFKDKKRFYTRGLPITKKLWRDGYNKAIDDMIIYVEMEMESPGDQPGKSSTPYPTERE